MRVKISVKYRSPITPDLTVNVFNMTEDTYDRIIKALRLGEGFFLYETPNAGEKRIMVSIGAETVKSEVVIIQEF